MMDINCDLGEGEASEKTRALMAQITSANIACGGHAGDTKSMRDCLQLCRELGVRAGAHPGLYDRENFGRVERGITKAKFSTLLAQQVDALSVLAKIENVPLTHIKLHGALYHMAEKDAALARTFVEFVKEYGPKLEIYGPPGGRVEVLARKNRVSFRGEIFADRAYTSKGTLLPRNEEGAVLTDLQGIEERVREWIRSEDMTASDGKRFFLPGGTICVHSDSPNSLQIAQRLRAMIQ